MAKRSQSDAAQAHVAYVRVGRGANHPLVNHAVADASTAAAKAGKTARLLAEAADHIAAYVNIMAPGSVPTKASAPDAMPTGESLIETAGSVTSRADSFLRRAASQVGDVKDAASATTKAVTDGTKSALTFVKGPRPSGSAATSQPVPARSDTPQSVTHEDAVSAVTVSIIGAAVVGRAALDHIKRRRMRKTTNDDQE